MRRSLVLKSLLQCLHSTATTLLAAECLTEGAGDPGAVDDLAWADMIFGGDCLVFPSIDETVSDTVCSTTLESGGVDFVWQTYLL